jgi:hypothetical protein
VKKITITIITICLLSCQSHDGNLHDKYLNELLFYKEKLENTRSQLTSIDTNGHKAILQASVLKLLNLETVLPKTINENTAALILNYKQAYLKLNKSNDKRNVILKGVTLELQQIDKLIADMQNNLWVASTEHEMANREIDAAKTLLLAEANFKSNILIANQKINQLNLAIDSTINFYRKEKVE